MPIRSIRFFLPIIDELRFAHVDQGYVNYLARKLADFLGKDLPLRGSDVIPERPHDKQRRPLPSRGTLWPVLNDAARRGATPSPDAHLSPTRSGGSSNSAITCCLLSLSGSFPRLSFAPFRARMPFLGFPKWPGLRCSYVAAFTCSLNKPGSILASTPGSFLLSAEGFHVNLTLPTR